MADIYSILLVVTCVVLLGWGLIRTERIYQYPFVIASIFASFVMPQAFSLIRNPGPVTPEALARVFLMSTLCLFMSWFGYQMPVNHRFINALDIKIDPKKFLYGGILFIAISSVALLLIMTSPLRHQNLWTGIITIYAFFSSLCFPGLTILLLSTLQRPTLAKAILTLIAAANPLSSIIGDGRREVTATFVLCIGLCLFFWRRILPPRWMAIAGVVGAAIAIPLFGQYRGLARNGKLDQLLELDPLAGFQEVVEKGQVLELRNAAILMDAAVKTGQYGFGTGYWNAIVFSFIPAQFTGRDLKADLQFQTYSYDLAGLYKYAIPNGSTYTGIGDSFIQFDYFGCLFFFLVAYLFKILWFSALYKKNVASQVFYISLFVPAMISVTHSTIRFAPDLVFRLIFIGGLALFSQKKSSQGIS